MFQNFFLSFGHVAYSKVISEEIAMQKQKRLVNSHVEIVLVKPF